MRVIVGITGASGIIIAVELLKRLKEIENVETHLIITEGGFLTIRDETNFDVYEINHLADVVYDVNELDASIASGSFLVDGMVIVPCTMKTVAGIAVGYGENLLKELADLGVVIMPPVMTFYNTPATIKDQISHIVDKILLQLGLPSELLEWRGGKK